MIQKFTGNFNPDDTNFINEMHARFPEKGIEFRFNQFLMLAAEDRIEKAKDMRKQVIRTGWNRRGVPHNETETLDEHVEGMKAMALKNIPDHPDLQPILDTAECHDNGEVIIGDFDKQDKKKINKEEKHRLEALAMALIYEAKPEMLDRWEAFEERKGFVGKFTVDLDAAQMCERRLAYALTHPGVDLSEFDTYFEAMQWQTEEGNALYQKLIHP